MVVLSRFFLDLHRFCDLKQQNENDDDCWNETVFFDFQVGEEEEREELLCQFGVVDLLDASEDIDALLAHGKRIAGLRAEVDQAGLCLGVRDGVLLLQADADSKGNTDGKDDDGEQDENVGKRRYFGSDLLFGHLERTVLDLSADRTHTGDSLDRHSFFDSNDYKRDCRQEI